MIYWLIDILVMTRALGALMPHVEDFGEFLRERLPGMCFVVAPDSPEKPEYERIKCILGRIGETPNLTAMMDNARARCCFYGAVEGGIFWAVGESVMSEPEEITRADGQKNYEFSLHKAVLTDVLALDARTGEPVEGVRVTMARDAVHLVSFDVTTDEDGYAVVPIIPGQMVNVTLKASQYLRSAPMTLVGSAAVTEYVANLDPGISFGGTVTDADGRPVKNARLHVDVGQGEWISDIDRPRVPYAEEDRADFERGSYSTDEHGRFLIATVPRGTIRIYATADGFAPSPYAHLDATDAESFPPVHLKFGVPRRAWVRIENSLKAAVQSSLSVIDEETGGEIIAAMTPDHGSLEIRNLPAKARFLAAAPGYAPYYETRAIQPDDEIVLTLAELGQAVYEIHVANRDGRPVEQATVSLAQAGLRAKYPDCMVRTDSAGIGVISGCPASFILEIFEPNYAPAELAIDEKSKNIQYIHLDMGTSASIKLVDKVTGKAMDSMQCTIRSEMPQSHIRHEKVIAADNGELKLEHLSNSTHKILCKNALDVRAELEFTLDNIPKIIEFPHFETMEFRVVDSYGGAVPYARLSVDGRIYESDEQGFVLVSGVPGTAVDAVQWQHGQGRGMIAAGAGISEIRLSDIPDEQAIQCAESLGMRTMTDSAAILIDDAGRMGSKGVLRGDMLESCGKTGIWVVRSDRRIWIER